MPEPPEGMTAPEVTAWWRVMPSIVALGTATEADTPALRLLVETLATADTAKRQLDHDGLVLVNASGAPRTHPAAGVMEKARSQAERMLSNFGLHPKARNAVPAAADVGEENPFNGL